MYYVIDSGNKQVVFFNEDKKKAQQHLATAVAPGLALVGPLPALAGADPEQYPALALQQQSGRELTRIVLPFLRAMQAAGITLEMVLEDRDYLAQQYNAFTGVDAAAAQLELREYRMANRSTSITKGITNPETHDFIPILSLSAEASAELLGKQQQPT